MARHTLSVLVNNHMGILSRVAGLFSRRGYNIDSLSVGETENPEFSRMTIVVDCEDDVFSQIKNQLAKLMDVITISDLPLDDSIRRELCLVKIDSMVLEVTGDHSKVSAIIEMLNEYGIKEVIRTGITAIGRGDGELKKANNEEEFI